MRSKKFNHIKLSLALAVVVNYDMPPDTSGYVHKIGRTGRANKTGASISLVKKHHIQTRGDSGLRLQEDTEES
ncbi:hypothetical protein GUJ93_ZPchr0007g5433 [Zizania palustris]|uniref:Helicase C-terminal domain-containing protein n=1 Tax=Zizania palustris TaxID=103762 RepID=A0A8J5SU72_ZIZPA|nr:hypothetical protein GUJ93_ZPchr0007g5433 [Zizania palustris]